MPTYRYEGNLRGGDSTAALRFGDKTVKLGETIELTEAERESASAYNLVPVGFAAGGTVTPVAAPVAPAPTEPSKASTNEPVTDESKSGSRSTLNVKPSPDDESLGRGL